MKISLVCAAVLVLLYGGLSFNVSRMRLQKRRGQVTEANLIKAIRAHGNASEYIPLFVILLLYLGSESSAYLDAIALLITISRCLHAAGMFRIASVDERHPLRFAGAAGTYLCLFALGGILLVRSL